MEIKDSEEILYEINKSKFLGYAYSVSTTEEVDEKLDCIRKQHQKATHICYAYVLSSPQVEKRSDDGEPDGTAGRPMLEVLKKNSFTNTLIVVVRYFGGIKLGAGGLVRAYSTSAKNTLDSTEKVEYIEWVEYEIMTPIENKNVLYRLQNESGFEIVGQMYTSEYWAKIRNVKSDIDLDKILSDNNIQVLKKSTIKLPKK